VLYAPDVVDEWPVQQPSQCMVYTNRKSLTVRGLNAIISIHEFHRDASLDIEN